MGHVKSALALLMIVTALVLLGVNLVNMYEERAQSVWHFTLD